MILNRYKDFDNSIDIVMANMGAVRSSAEMYHSNNINNIL